MLSLLNNERTLICKILLQNNNEIILIGIHLAAQSEANKIDLTRLETLLSKMNDRYSKSIIIVLGDLNIKPSNKLLT